MKPTLVDVAVDNTTKLPSEMVTELGDRIWFLRGKERWEAWKESDLEELLKKGAQEDIAFQVPSTAALLQWYSVKSPEHHSEWRILVANGLVAAAEHSSPVVVTRPWAPYEKNFRKWGWVVLEISA